MTQQRKWDFILSGKRSQGVERGHANLCYEAIWRKYYWRKQWKRVNETNSNMLKGMWINKNTLTYLWYTERNLEFGDKVSGNESLRSLSMSPQTTPHQAFCFGRGHINVPSLSKVIQSQKLRTINISGPASLFHVFPPPCAVAADPLSGLWGEISPPKQTVETQRNRKAQVGIQEAMETPKVWGDCAIPGEDKVGLPVGYAKAQLCYLLFFIWYVTCSEPTFHMSSWLQLQIFQFMCF